MGEPSPVVLVVGLPSPKLKNSLTYKVNHSRKRRVDTVCLTYPICFTYRVISWHLAGLATT